MCNTVALGKCFVVTRSWLFIIIVYKSEGGQMMSAINSQVLAKLHLAYERVDIREVVWCLIPLANYFIL